LDQIVRSQLEKVYFTRDLLGGQNSGWDFNHRPNLNFCKRHVLTREPLNLLFDDTLRKPDVTHIRNHRNHETQWPGGSCPQDRTNLRPHDLLVTQTKTDRTQTERGIALALLQVRPELTTNIEQTHNRAVLSRRLDQRFVNL